MGGVTTARHHSTTWTAAVTNITDNMTDPVISSVESINHQDFESISDDVSHQRDDVLFMRLGVDDSSCQYCPENLSTTEQMKTHISETKELIGHLKTNSRTSTSQAQAEKKESTALKEGFYHPTLKRPKHSGVSRHPNKSEKMEQLPNKK